MKFSEKGLWIAVIVTLSATFLVESAFETISWRKNRKLTNELAQRRELRIIEWERRVIERRQREKERRQWKKEYHREKMKQLIWERERREKNPQK